jgi:hypothetical protein
MPEISRKYLHPKHVQVSFSCLGQD